VNVCEEIETWFAMHPTGPCTDERQLLNDAADEIERLTQRLAAAEELLREVVVAYTEACVIASEDGKCSKEYGVAIVGNDWYKRAKEIWDE
jgi:hypothetical protein